jgi:hypothetical protein
LTVDVGPVGKPSPKPVPDTATAATTPPVTDAPPADSGAPSAPSGATSRAPQDSPASEQSSAGNVQRVFGAVVGGLGVASFGVSALFWRKAASDIKIEPNGRKLAQDDLLITNVGLVSGSILVTGGIVLFLTAPSGPARSSRAPALLQPSLLIGKNTAFVGASGRF